jgi:hypothetical protein
VRASDFYVFIDFRRERLGTSRPPVYRGSLFTNQELAIAYILDFENAIFLQQEGIELNGILRYMGSNSERFKRTDEVPHLVRALVNDRHWDVRYTRHLEVGELQWSPPLLYGDHTGQRRRSVNDDLRCPIWCPANSKHGYEQVSVARTSGS